MSQFSAVAWPRKRSSVGDLKMFVVSDYPAHFVRLWQTSVPNSILVQWALYALLQYIYRLHCCLFPLKVRPKLLNCMCVCVVVCPGTRERENLIPLSFSGRVCDSYSSLGQKSLNSFIYRHKNLLHKPDGRKCD